MRTADMVKGLQKKLAAGLRKILRGFCKPHGGETVKTVSIARLQPDRVIGYLDPTYLRRP